MRTPIPSSNTRHRLRPTSWTLCEGKLRHHKFGEGSYDETERAIQKLLAETGAAGIGRDLASVAPGGVEAPADWEAVRSPETYLGTDRGENRVASPAKRRLNQWALSGD